MLKPINHKIIWLVRHAKSSWDSDAVTDHDRPLNKRGMKDAQMMGRRLKKLKTIPQLIISSSATRAQMTAKLIAQEIGYKRNHIEIDPDIYGAGIRGLTEIICHLDDSLNQVMLVGHNPDITETINWLANTYIDNSPTCSITTLQVGSDSWSGFTKGAADLVRYDYPKKEFDG